jgi:carboxyl-terminal processing protease
MKRSRTLAILFALPVLAIGVSGFLPSESADLFQKVARTVASELPRQHLSRRTLDDAVSQLMFKNFISSLDYDRLYFLASDIQSFSRKEMLLDDELQEGNLDFASEIFEVFKERVRNRLAYTEKLLAAGFDFSVEESYRWKRKDEPWAVDEAEWNELWRKRIKNEYLRRMIAKSFETAAIPAATNSPMTVSADPLPLPVPGALPAGAAVESGPAESGEGDADASRERNFSPEEFIRDRYTQYLHILEDSDPDWLVQQYLSAFAKSFDPHCDYMSPTTAEEFEIEMKLSLVGIGAVLRPEDGTARIVSLMSGGPAARDKREQRLRPGDKIIAVAQGDEPPVSVIHWPLNRTVRLIRGDIGSRVVLTVIPADPTAGATKMVDLIRDEVKLEEREAKSRVEIHTTPEGRQLRIGVVVLPSFYADMSGKRMGSDFKSSAGDVAAILRKMRDENVDGIILDLRNNPGGLLIEAVLMTGLFIETGPVVLVKERRAISILPDTDPTIAYTGPLIVLVSRISASASEILAAALQDYGRAVIIGDSKTHGKGSVQSVLKLGRQENMGSIRVTSALYYRISGGSTQLKGVEPDIVIPSAFDVKEFGEDSSPNPLEWSTVRPVMFSPFDDLARVIPDLRARSEARRSSDERYRAYRELLSRIETMNSDLEISLNCEARKARAQTEKELLDMQNRLIDQVTSEIDAPPDLIAEESIRIMGDLIQLKTTVPQPAPEPEEEPVPEAGADWESAQTTP